MQAAHFQCSETWRDGRPDDAAFFVPPEIMRKEDLFAAYDAGMTFPWYFGNNWDAFNDCIKDRSWIPNQRVLVRHCDLPLASKPSDLRIYLEILTDAVLERNVQKGPHVPRAPALIVLFPAACLARIAELPEP